MLKNSRNKWETEVEYEVDQFNLVNPTGSPVQIDLFDTHELTNTPVVNLPFTPVASQAQLQVSGGATVTEGMGYLPSLNYMFITAPNGTRVVWDVSNKVQISEYSVAASALFGNIIERPSDGLLWGTSGTTSDLIQSDWQAMTQTLFPVTGIPSESGVYYDSVTDTIFFGASSLFLMGAFDLATNTLTDISTPDTRNLSLAIDIVNRKIYGAGFSPIGAVVTEIDMDTKTVTNTYNFSGSGLSSILIIGLEESSGKLYGAGAIGASNHVGLLDTTSLVFTSLISGLSLVFGRFLNFIFTNDMLFVYDTRSATDTITTINTISDTVVDSKVAVGGSIISSTTAFMILAPNQYIYASKGFAGSAIGYLTEFPITQQFYITGSVDYNFFVRSIFTAPKRAYAIEINVLQTHLSNEWIIINKDANGQECSVPYLPNNGITNFQFYSNQALITFDEGYLMDITSKSRYTIPANTTVVILIWYKEFKRSEKLIRKVDFSKGEGGIAKEQVNQQDRTGVEIKADSGRNVFNYWIPSTEMVNELSNDGFYPEGWKNMEQMVPSEMIVSEVLKK